MDAELRPTRPWASDILTDAVDFVSAQFGVNGAYSDGEPSRFDPGEKFDFIWVASLFSHLPAPLFDAWLSKLSDLLSPDGVVCFSVHDETLLPTRTSMPPTGIHFRSRSESTKLGRDAYGATYVTEAYVAAAVGRTFGEAHPYFRLKRGLAYQQDLYIVAKNPARNLGLAQFVSMGSLGMGRPAPNFRHGELVPGWLGCYVRYKRHRIHLGLLRWNAVRSAHWHCAAGCRALV